MKPLPRTANAFSLGIIAAAVGLVDAAYLAAKHFSGSPVECSLLNGCEKVTTSAYATIADVPVALLGAVFYFGMLIAGVTFRETSDSRLAIFLFLGGMLGFLFSLWLVAAQVFILNALCFWCLVSAGTSTLLFLFGFLLVRDIRKRRLLVAGESGAAEVRI